MSPPSARVTPPIRDLAIIGDRRTAAVIGRDGAVLWYCPHRFDCPSLFAGLLDPSAGVWSVDLAGSTPGPRRYVDDSAVLETRLRTAAGDLVITDCMPVSGGAPSGLLCRRFSAAPADTRIAVVPRPDYARRQPDLARSGSAVVIDGTHHLRASHPLNVEDGAICFTLPEGEAGWAVLSDAPLDAPTPEDLDCWLASTVEHWRALAERTRYSGPYEREVKVSLQAIRLLCHEETGGIIAAVTTSLPEVLGGTANWDYRYVWLRDAGMIVSALIRLGGDLTEAERYLDFICSARGSSSSYPIAVFASLDGAAAPGEELLDLAGYLSSRPVRIGNDAREQIQLDAFANVLLAAKLLYGRTDHRPHWAAVEEVAAFLVEHWREPDHGIWEEAPRRQYTANKVIVAVALEFIADFSADEAQAKRWREVAWDIREFVANHCLTAQGAYAVYAGSEEVDVSAALFPAWAYTAADAPEMRATITALERDCSWNGLLYWRRLEGSNSRREGIFLAGTFWVAQYWVARGDLERARRIIDKSLRYANDLGLFAEEADPRGSRMLGNIPQSFVHAAFIGAVLDLKNASTERKE